MSRADELWARLGGDPSLLSALTLSGGPVLPSLFDVTAFAMDTVAMASLALSEVIASRSRRGDPIPTVRVESVEASAAFRCEALFEPLGWERPPLWDPVAGDYRAKDRWIKLHTNYAHHRTAALRVLETGADRSAVEKAVATWDAAELESAIGKAGGCAAAMYTRDEWLAHPHGAATRDAPPITFEVVPSDARPRPRSRADDAGARPPLEGIKVLDLTRVIAGPVCTRFLAAYGASVLRIDPPGFEEVGALLPETTLGKRCAALALDTADGRACFERLVDEADVIVLGLRPGALERLGLFEARIRERNPSILMAVLDAYGWEGPWRDRRGFDSLVQMSSGIAAASGLDRPRPLPAQALDHGAGYLLAAGVLRGLALRTRGTTATVRASLLGIANHLLERVCGSSNDGLLAPPTWPASVFEERDTSWGRARAVRVPGRIAIDGARASFRVAAGPLARHAPTFDEAPPLDGRSLRAARG